MGYDYLLVHLTYTIPPTILLSLIFAPVCTRLDVYKILLIITAAVTATIPWIRFLIHSNIWSYAPNVLLGPTFFDVPVEVVFFFVAQTLNTSLMYLILNKPVLHSIYLVKETKSGKFKYIKVIGQLGIALSVRQGVQFVRDEGNFMYMGLILVWALIFLGLLWSLSYQFLTRLPLTSVAFPIALPTLYLCFVDKIALKQGKWAVSTATKSGMYLWTGLELEEAVYFLLTNAIIVFGLVTFDNALAILNTFPAHFPRVPTLPSPLLLIRALLLPAAAYDDDRILGLKQSVSRLQEKSGNTYLASGAFQGRLRIDLILLYSFCRLAEDLIDNSKSTAEAKQWVQKLKTFVNISYSGPSKNANGDLTEATDVNQGSATIYIVHNFPPECQLTLFLLPTSRMTKEPLEKLIKGFEMDLTFSTTSPTGPIKSETDLDLYAERTTSTIAQLCIELILHHHPNTPTSDSARLFAATHDMGIALQYIHIARDVSIDAQLTRCYVPASWLKKEKLTPESFINGLCKSAENTTPDSRDAFFAKKVALMRARLLDRADELYEKSVSAIEDLPRDARAPVGAAVESYRLVGREMRKAGDQVVVGRAKVEGWKRVWVAWWSLMGPC